VVALPGVPQEMQAMVEAHVVPRLRDERRAVRVVELRTALVGESELAARLRPLEADLPSGVRVAYLAGPAEVRVRIVATAADPGPCAARAQQLLGDLVVAVDESLEARVCRLLRDRSATVATAESLTGGLLGAAITGVAGASAVYSGGVVAYATEAKTALLGVDAELLATVGPVHREVALAMAAGVRQRFATTYGVATTGVAGPEPQGGQPVGTVHVAVVGPDGARALLLRRGGWRDAVRRRAVVAALELVRRAALGLDPHPAESSG
jgi:nicotinamide-nucleotide amidase